MKTNILILIAVTAFYSTYAQSPLIQWQNTIGASSGDFLYTIEQTSDNGYILGGYSSSGMTGDKTEGLIGGTDYWVVKLDSNGTISWQNTIGGNNTDQLLSAQQTSDGGYILGGYSISGISGDKTEASLGLYDYWVVKLNSSGSIEWQNTIGGNGHDYLFSLDQTTDGGYILGGFTESGISGDKTEASAGSYDYWVVKLNSSGGIQWQNTIGGSSSDILYSLEQTTDGGYILGGYSSSGNSGDKTEASLGGTDYWLVKLNSSGTIQWQNTIGGGSLDELHSVQQTTDGGYILGGYSYSDISGDKTEDALGGFDYWVVKVNSTGSIVWQNTIGGNNGSILYSIKETLDGGYFLGGQSLSGIAGDKTEPSLGSYDYWVLKLNSTGAIEWQNTLGGSNEDVLQVVQQTSDKGYVLAGYSYSGISGDKSEASLGSSDYWIIKLYPECPGLLSNIFEEELIETCEAEIELQTNTTFDAYNWSTGESTASIFVEVSGWYSISVDSASCTSTDSIFVQFNVADTTEEVVNSCDTLFELPGGDIVFASGAYLSFLTNSDGCDSIIITNLTLGCTPIADFTYSGAASEVLFTDISENSPTSWTWFFGDGTYSYEQNPAHSYAGPGNYAVCLIAENAAGSDTYCTLIEVEGDLPPVADFSYSTTDGITTFTDLSLNTPTNWLWWLGDGATSTLQNPEHTYAASGTYPVCLKVQNAEGNDLLCGLIDVCIDYQLSIVGDGSICAGQTETILCNLPAATSFEWLKDGIPVVIPDATFSSATVTESGSYSLSYIEPNGCIGITDAIVVVSTPPPSVSLELPDDTVCRNDGLILLAGGSPSGGVYTGTGVVGGTYFDPVAAGTGTTTLTYSYTDVEGCSNSATDEITVFANPSATIILASASLNLCINNPVILIANSGVGLTYQWYRNNNPIAGATTLGYNATMTGNYQVLVTNASGCSKLSAKKKVVNTGCRLDEEAAGEMEFLVYPNPNDGLFYFSLESEQLTEGEVQIRMFDMQGKIVHEQTAFSGNGVVSGTIDVDLSEGVYSMQMTLASGVKIHQHVVLVNK